jgi:signal transduction histidine kinase
MTALSPATRYLRTSCIFFLLTIATDMAMAQSTHAVPELLALSEKNRLSGDIKEATRYLNDAAIVRWEEKNYKEAIDYFDRSLLLNKQINNESGIDKINSNLGMIYSDMQNFEKSLSYFQQSLVYRKKNDLRFESVSTYVNLSVVLNNLKQHNLAAQNLEDALKLATEMNDAQQMKSCYGMLAETYEKAGNEAKTIHYFGLYRTFHEMIQRNKETGFKQEIEKTRLVALLKEAESKNKELELQVQKKQLADASRELVAVSKDANVLMDSLSKSELAVALLKRQNEVKELENKESETKLENQYIFTLLSFTGLVLMLLTLGLFYRNYKQKKSTNQLLHARNEEITALNDNLDDLVVERTQKLEATLEKLKKRNALLSQFSWTVSHNLRGPISSILGIESVFNKQDLSDPTNAIALGHISKATQNLDSVVRDLSDILNMYADEEMDIIKISIPEVFASVTASLQEEISKANAKIVTEYSGISSVSGVKAFVESILYNLVSNAIKYRDFDRKLLVSIKAVKLGNQVCLSVSDNGIGIDLASINPEKIFGLYQRFNLDRPGKGVGLFLVKSQAEALDGRVELDSEVGKGTTVRVFLPLVEEPVSQKETTQVLKPAKASEPTSLVAQPSL